MGGIPGSVLPAERKGEGGKGNAGLAAVSLARRAALAAMFSLRGKGRGKPGGSCPAIRLCSIIAFLEREESTWKHQLHHLPSQSNINSCFGKQCYKFFLMIFLSRISLTSVSVLVVLGLSPAPSLAPSPPPSRSAAGRIVAAVLTESVHSPVSQSVSGQQDLLGSVGSVRLRSVVITDRGDSSTPHPLSGGGSSRPLIGSQPSLCRPFQPMGRLGGATGGLSGVSGGELILWTLFGAVSGGLGKMVFIIS